MSLCSLEDPIREEESETRLSLMVDEKAKNPDYKVNEFYLKEALVQGLDKLTVKERTVVSLLYYEDLSLSEIAEVMSLLRLVYPSYIPRQYYDYAARWTNRKIC